MVHKYKEVYVFLDTVIFMQYKALDQLPLCEFFDSEEVIVLIAPATSTELEKHKQSNRRRLVERANTSLKLLPKNLEVQELGQGIKILRVIARYTDYESFQLDKNRPDDQLILSAIHYQSEHPQEQIRLLTEDGGMLATATNFGIIAIEPPEEWKLPPESDPTQKKLELLERKFSMSPDLVLGFTGQKSFQEVELPEPPNLDNSFVQSTMRKLRECYPFDNTTYMPLLGMNITGTEPSYSDAHSRKAELIKFFDDYERLLPAWLERESQMARTCTLSFSVFNQGGSLATGIRAECNFPVELKLLSELPDKVQLPHPPLSLSERAAQKLISVIGPYESPLDSILVRPKNKATESKSAIDINGKQLKLSLDELLHKDHYDFKPIYAVFNDRRQAKSFNINGRIIYNGIREWQPIQLQVKVHLGGLVTSANWRIPYVDN